MSKLRPPPRLKRLKTPSHITITKRKPIHRIYYEDFLPKHLPEKQPAELICKKGDYVNSKPAHIIRVFTGTKTTPKPPSINELLLEILRMRQQLNIYENMITNHNLLLQEVLEWRNRMTTERAIYEDVYSVILNKIDACSHNLKLSMKKPRVLTHMYKETSLVLNLKIEPDGNH